MWNFVLGDGALQFPVYGEGCQCAEKARKEEQEKQPVPGQRSIFDYLSEEDDENDE